MSFVDCTESLPLGSNLFSFSCIKVLAPKGLRIWTPSSCELLFFVDFPSFFVDFCSFTIPPNDSFVSFIAANDGL